MILLLAHGWKKNTEDRGGESELKEKKLRLHSSAALQTLPRCQMLRGTEKPRRLQQHTVRGM